RGRMASGTRAPARAPTGRPRARAGGGAPSRRTGAGPAPGDPWARDRIDPRRWTALREDSCWELPRPGTGVPPLGAGRLSQRGPLDFFNSLMGEPWEATRVYLRAGAPHLPAAPPRPRRGCRARPEAREI